MENRPTLNVVLLGCFVIRKLFARVYEPAFTSNKLSTSNLERVEGREGFCVVGGGGEGEDKKKREGEGVEEDLERKGKGEKLRNT